MASYESITKQMYINKFDLPGDLLNEIKKFCFYDTKSWETMNFIKYKKRRIDYLFKNSTISRANPFPDNDDYDGHWAFWTFDEADGPNPQFQCCTCTSCGNYKIIGSNNPNDNKVGYTNKIFCYCSEGDDYDDLPPLIEIDDDSDSDDDE